jgi:hypothetical protein
MNRPGRELARQKSSGCQGARSHGLRPSSGLHGAVTRAPRRAVQVSRSHINPAADTLGTRRLPFETDDRPVQWQLNRVAIGLSAGFLESTAIGLIEMGISLLSQPMPMGR